ncbi:MAG: HPr family phosphocarrier protein [Myxococcales bacterium]|nr:HPr family phosphocarrier protein [Myxococcales bacterium]MCB9734617.1 HPr family phosphocarrier protein [Deltaproteobacteria bacterium]
MTGNVVSAELLITNEKGLHVRAATALAKVCGRFESVVTVSRNGETVDAKSVMGLLLLTASKGTTIFVEARGGDAQEALMAVRELVGMGFYE